VTISDDNAGTKGMKQSRNKRKKLINKKKKRWIFKRPLGGTKTLKLKGKGKAHSVN